MIQGRIPLAKVSRRRAIVEARWLRKLSAPSSDRGDHANDPWTVRRRVSATVRAAARCAPHGLPGPPRTRSLQVRSNRRADYKRCGVEPVGRTVDDAGVALGDERVDLTPDLASSLYDARGMGLNKEKDGARSIEPVSRWCRCRSGTPRDSVRPSPPLPPVDSARWLDQRRVVFGGTRGCVSRVSRISRARRAGPRHRGAIILRSGRMRRNGDTDTAEYFVPSCSVLVSRRSRNKDATLKHHETSALFAIMRSP